MSIICIEENFDYFYYEYKLINVKWLLKNLKIREQPN